MVASCDGMRNAETDINKTGLKCQKCTTLFEELLEFVVISSFLPFLEGADTSHF